jgi:sugar/nucleoside kinase (ribokinase family)
MTYDYSSIGFYTFDCLCWPFESVPEGSGTNMVTDFTLAVSGAAGTAVIAAAKLGLTCLATGGIGQDLMGDWVDQRLRSFGIDVSGLQRRPGWKTSSSIVTTRRNGSRPVQHMKGATSDFYVEDSLLPQVIDAQILHLGGIGLMDQMDRGRNADIARQAKARGAITTADVFAASPADMPAVESILPFTDYFMPSIDEAAALTGLNDRADLAKYFLDRGVRCCVFTLGEEGAYYHHADGTVFTLPAFDITVCCSCGCGDVFDGAFAAALRHQMDPETAVRFSQAASALNATGLGSQAGLVSFERTMEFMERTPTRGSGAVSLSRAAEEALAD